MNKRQLPFGRNAIILMTFLLITFNIIGQSDCKVSDLRTETSACDNDGNFDVFLNFKHENTSDSFRVLGNGKNYGTFAYSSLPIKLSKLAANCTTNYEFVVRDKANNDCTAFLELGKKCCDNKCQLQVDNVEVGECNDGKYQLYLGTIRTNSDAATYTVYNNGTKYGTYEKGKFPLTLKEFPASSTQTYNQVVVCSGASVSCCDTLKLVNPCVCSVYNVQGQITNCDTTKATFDLTINFDHVMTSDSFRIGGNAINYGIYAFKDVPITIKDLPIGSGKDFEFLVADKNNIFCFGVLELGEINDCNRECDIDDVTAKPLVCVDGSFFVEIKFKSKNTSIKGFEIRGNGMSYGTYQYGLDKYRIGPLKGDCNNVFEVVIIDKDNPDCTSFAIVKNEGCCACNIRDFVVTEECDNNVLVAYKVNFRSDKTAGTFNLFLNNIKIGNYKYTDLPIRITNVSLSAPTASFRVVDGSDERCNATFAYEFECFQAQKCDFRDFVVTSGACNNDNKFYGIVKFRTSNPGTRGFYVQVNGVVIDTFEYGKTAYEVGPLNGCDTTFKFFIIDVQYSECREDFNLVHKSCCDEKCEFSNPRFETSPCKDGKYSVSLNFDHQGTSLKFDLYINGVLKRTVNYKDLPINLEGLESKVKYSIVVRDHENNDCRKEINLPIKECTTATTDYSNGSVRLFPNPSREWIAIAVDQKNQVEIIDLLGKTCMTAQVDVQLNTLNIRTLAKGIYFVKLTNSANQTRTTKLIVE